MGNGLGERFEKLNLENWSMSIMWSANGEREKVKRKVEVKAKVKGEGEVKEDEFSRL
jgi:hypothetical protein